LQVVRRILRFFILLLLAGYVLSACLMLGVRYLVLPNIDRWRPEIEEQISKSLKAKVLIGEIGADWVGLQPRLSIQNLQIFDPNDKPLLTLPGLYAVASWSSVLLGELRFSLLEVDGLELSGIKHPDGRVTFIDLEMEPLDPDHLSTPTRIAPVSWLLSQGSVVLRNARLRWTDLTRSEQVLVLSDIDVTVQNGLFTHELKMTATPPKGLGQRFELLMRADHAFTQPFAPSLGRKLEFYGEVDQVNPLAWRPWFDLPELSGVYSARAWVEFQKGHLTQSTIDIKGKNASGPLSGLTWRAKDIDVRIQGWLADVLDNLHSDLMVPSADRSGVDMLMLVQGLEIEGALFDPSPLALKRLELNTKITKSVSGQVQFKFDKLAALNSELDLALDGTWTQGGLMGLGLADIKGVIHKLEASSLYKILPTTISPEPRSWLKQSLVTGQFVNASLRLKGDLAFFPFNACGHHGDFVIEGGFKDLTMDYSPPTNKQLGWPVAQAMNGTIKIDGLGLDMTVNSGNLHSPHPQPVLINSLVASTPDMHFDPRLDLSIKTSGAAQSYLDTLVKTPIGERMGEGFDAVTMSGDLAVPFNLKMNLAAPAYIDVEGVIDISQSVLSLSKELPDISDLSGKIEFSSETVRFNEVQARLLDGKVRVEGAFDRADGYIQINGVLGAEWLTRAGKLPSDKLLSGSFDYAGKMKLNAVGGIDASFTSNLVGLGVDLPAPFGKSREQNLALKVQFNGSRKALDQRKSLSFDYGSKVRGRLERTTAKRAQPYFNRAAISVGGDLKLPVEGLAVDAMLDRFDWDIWADSYHSFFGKPKSDSNPDAKLLPALVSAKLRTPQLVWSDISLSELTLSLDQVSQGGGWRVSLNSKETDGTINWRQAAGAIAGDITARFTRLVLGSAAEVIKTDIDPEREEVSAAQARTLDQWVDMPTIDLAIDDLTLYGNKLGSLRFKGSNLERGERWKIEQLKLDNPHATLLAEGTLRLVPPSRGVTLNGDLVVKDMGELSAFMGYPDRVKDGSGTLNAKIEWKNFPWVFDYTTMSGSAQVNLKNGVFQHETSRSARLLELLSVQSLQRLFSLNFKSSTIFENGFPWNTIIGNFAIKNGVVATQDLTIAAPVADILLTGTSDLSKKMWDMQADVKPIFDLSGTAVATGFVVNPFVGIGALIGQFLLRNPIEKALTARYTVTGPWDDPKLEPLAAVAPTNNSGTAVP
jgi:uncharacterized protein (TIGR02099 family)